MTIADFFYHKPSSLKEACQILNESPDGVPLAGGTDLLVEMKRGLRHHEDVVSLAEIQDLKRIAEEEGNLIIGAGVTHNMLIASPLIKEHSPAIAEAASKIGTEQIRNVGTVGGNLCTGASCCDMAPILMAYDASFEIESPDNVRTVSSREFFISHKKTRIRKGEILTSIKISRNMARRGASYEKFGLREAASISVASIAAVVEIHGEICSDVCIVIGAVAPTPKVSDKAIAFLKGKKISELSEDSSILIQAGEAAADDALPIDDLRSSATYRRNIIKVLTQRAVLKAALRAYDLRNR